MPVASSASTTARRGVLGSAASLLALATAVPAATAHPSATDLRAAPAPNPDAALLALCADLQVAVAECNGASHLCDVHHAAGDTTGSKRAWEAMDAASDRANRLLEWVTPITPRTMPGLLAKARAVQAIGPHFGTDSHRDLFEAAGDAIVADILGLGGAA